MKYKIYKLIYKGSVVYIGRTTGDLQKRKWKGYHFNLEVKKIQKECSIELIEETDDISRERFWIKNYRENGYNLLNKKKGDGLDRTTLEYKEYQKTKANKYYILNKKKYKQYYKEYYNNKKRATLPTEK